MDIISRSGQRRCIEVLVSTLNSLDVIETDVVVLVYFPVFSCYWDIIPMTP
jgi:hypothetical protein